MAIKRYDISSGSSLMLTQESGHYVEYKDYAAMKTCFEHERDQHGRDNVTITQLRTQLLEKQKDHTITLNALDRELAYNSKTSPRGDTATLTNVYNVNLAALTKERDLYMAEALEYKRETSRLVDERNQANADKAELGKCNVNQAQMLKNLEAKHERVCKDWQALLEKGCELRRELNEKGVQMEECYRIISELSCDNSALKDETRHYNDAATNIHAKNLVHQNTIASLEKELKGQGIRHDLLRGQHRVLTNLYVEAKMPYA